MSNKKAAIEVIDRLQERGHQALLAGGCVRDMLLGRPASDYDVATDALPQEVSTLFRRTIQVGAKFGVVIVLLRGRQVEVATFRSEAGYVDGRHPTEVRFTSPAEDASRRDFTINGMFYDPSKDEVIDYVGGRADLNTGIIRTIGDPQERFGEDYLRMLRAIRFSTRLDFPIEPATYEAIRRNAANISRISGERIAIELEGALTHPNRERAAAMLIDTGLAEAIFPGFAGGCTESAVAVLRELRSKVDFPLALAAFFAGCSIEFAIDRSEVLRLSKKQMKHLHFLLAHRGRLADTEMPLSQLKMLLAEPYFRDLCELERATGQAQGAEGELAALRRLQERVRRLGDVNVKPKPLLNGHDLMRLGAPRGPVLGQLAEELYVAQLEGDVRTREQAKRWAGDWLRRHHSPD